MRSAQDARRNPNFYVTLMVVLDSSGLRCVSTVGLGRSGRPRARASSKSPWCFDILTIPKVSIAGWS